MLDAISGRRVPTEAEARANATLREHMAPWLAELGLPDATIYDEARSPRWTARATWPEAPGERPRLRNVTVDFSGDILDGGTILEPLDLIALANGYLDRDGRPDWPSAANWLMEVFPQPEAKPDPWVNAASLDGRPVPAREWHVPGLVPARTVTLLGGDGGTGKSLLAMQLAAATAVGGAWIGREVREGAALYLSAEDDLDELHRRFADVLSAEGSNFADAGSLTIRSLAGEDALLARLDRSGGLMASDLYNDLNERMAVLRPALVVLDTLADLFPGNENDRAQARAFVGLIRGLAIRHNCAVVVLAHPSLTGLSTGTGASGSTGWSNSVRSRLYFERIVSDGYEPDPDARRLVLKKSNYARTGSEIAMHWREGVFVPDLAETGLDRKANGAKAERVFLKLLAVFTEQGRHVSPSPSVSYAPTVFAKHPEAEGVTKRAMETAMNALFSADRIRVATHGRASKERKCIVLSEVAE